MDDGWEAAHSTDFRKSPETSSRHKPVDGRRRGFCPDHRLYEVIQVNGKQELIQPAMAEEGADQDP
jgi:hypothetical protein